MMCKTSSAWLFVAVLLVLTAPTLAEEWVLADEGRTGFRIVLPADADLSTTAVALDLASILHEMTGATYPVVPDETPAMDRAEIILGRNNARLASLGLAGFADTFAQGEYRILTRGKHIIIAGGPPRGTINGVYGFLQDHLGCRWLTPGCQHVPKRSSITLAPIDDHQTPAFRYRTTDSPMHWDANWTVRNRLNESKASAGGPRPASIMQLHADARTASMTNSWNPHAFQDIPAELYEQHPEWYAQIDGQRVLAESPVQQAYCLSNEGFVGWVSEWTVRRLQKDPGKQFISITHADNEATCQCPACAETYDRIGPTGASIAFANKVTERVVKDFPDIFIITFAYHSTFAPSPIPVHPNIRVVWAPIGADYAYALDEGGTNQHAGYMDQLTQWQAQASRVGTWYYQFNANLPLPKPSLYATRRSMAALQAKGVDQAFIEMYFNPCQKASDAQDADKTAPAYAASPDYYTRADTYASWFYAYGAEHINGYINCRLLWDTDFDIDAGIKEFCEIYYGAAGEEMARIARIREALDSYDLPYASVGDQSAAYMRLEAPPIKPEALERIDALFVSALEKAADDPVSLRRVEVSRLGFDLAIMCYAPEDHPLRPGAYDRFISLSEQLDLPSTINVPGLGGLSADDIKHRLSNTALAGQ